jgi:ABC-2 type transport system permease protein
MVTMTQRLGLLVFLLGKILRFALFLIFLIVLLKGTNTLAGYNLNQTVFFFLTFNLIDVISQFLFREVYRFRKYIVTGSFDLSLVKPISALFRSLMGGADIIDLITIPPLIIALFIVGRSLNPTFLSVILYFVLLVNGLLIASAFHIAVLALGIITFEIDHTVMIYRDLTSLGRLPIDIYKQPLQGFLTFLVPVGIMMTLPAKTLMGKSSPLIILVSLFIGLLSIFLSVRFWNYALTKYSSASS